MNGQKMLGPRWLGPWLAAAATCLLLLAGLALMARGPVAHAQTSCGPTVTSGFSDTLAEIALRCNIPVEAILALNPTLTGTTRLEVGQVVQLPAPADLPVATPVVAPVTPPVTAVVAVTMPAITGPGVVVTVPAAAPMAVPVVTPAVTASPAVTYTIYTVQPGDWLSKIARRFGVSLAVLQAANPQIVDPNRIEPGQQIRVPPAGTVAIAAPASAAVPATTGAATTTVTGGAIPATGVTAVSITPATAPLGARVEITATGLAPNTDMSIGLAGDDPAYAAVRQIVRTDAQGVLHAIIEIPLAAGTGVPALTAQPVVVPQPIPAEQTAIAQQTLTTQQVITTQQVATTTVAPQVALPVTTPPAIAGGIDMRGGTPLVWLMPTAGPPGTIVEITGTGFISGEVVQLSVGQEGAGYTLWATVPVTAGGIFTQLLPVPAGLAPGTRWVVAATSGTTGFQAISNAFTVAATTPVMPAPAVTAPASIYLVALGDAGRSGKSIACSDSLLPVEVEVDVASTLPRAALEQLLTLGQQTYGPAGLYNALYQSSLMLDDVLIEAGEAQVYLSGEIVATDMCEAARIRAQLEETALQGAGVEFVTLYVNGQLIDDVLQQ
jgi:LysM repeat protein